jgi:hypothetical protein
MLGIGLVQPHGFLVLEELVIVWRLAGGRGAVVGWFTLT